MTAYPDAMCRKCAKTFSFLKDINLFLLIVTLFFSLSSVSDIAATSWRYSATRCNCPYSAFFTSDPPNTSLIFILSSSSSIFRTSSTVRAMSVAPIFSFRRQRCRVPGIGTIHGRLQSIQARAIYESVTWCSSARRLSKENRLRFCSKLSLRNCGMEAR